MLRARAPHLSSLSPATTATTAKIVPPPALTAFKHYVLPTLAFSSPSHSNTIPSSSSSSLLTFSPKPHLPSRSLFLSPGLNSGPSMRVHHRLSAAASFNTDSSGGSGKEILVQHLLVKESDAKLLVELQQRIAAGEDLSDLAVEYSICPSKEEGGMLGWVRKGQMVPEFEEAAFSAPLNRVVKCKTKFGWHLLQVLSEREESVLQDILPEEFHVKMQDPSFFEEAQLIDVREPDEVDKASLPGFQVLPLRQFGSWGPEITAKLDTEKDTYVMCHHGMRSLQVAKWLQTQGFKRVFNLSGGIHAYAVKADPSVPTY